MGKTKIPWTMHTWNPMHGCSPVGPECDRCYARVMAARLKGSKAKGYESGFGVTLRHDRLREPSTLRKPQMVFLCSMGDLFHERVPYTFQSLVFDTMMEEDRHVYQVLTKRPGRMKEFVKEWVAERFKDPDDWYKVRHIWLGTSVGTQNGVIRALELVEVPARNRMLSVEPLIEAVNLRPILWATTPRTRALWMEHTKKAWACGSLIEWVIVGGENGPGARPMQLDWVMRVKHDCERVEVPFFFKGWGATKPPTRPYPSQQVEQFTKLPVEIREHLGRKAA